jgi:hypothetical protein
MSSILAYQEKQATLLQSIKTTLDEQNGAANRGRQDSTKQKDRNNLIWTIVGVLLTLVLVMQGYAVLAK